MQIDAIAVLIVIVLQGLFAFLLLMIMIDDASEQVKNAQKGHKQPWTQAKLNKKYAA